MDDTDARKPGHELMGKAPADAAVVSRGGRPRRTVFPDQPPPQSRTTLRKLRHEIGIGLPLLEELRKQHPDDHVAQLAGFFREFRIPAATGRKRPVAIKTRAKYFHIMHRVMASLRELNMRNRNLTEMSTRQVRAVHRQWEAAGASDSSLAMLNTVLRRFGVWMGKPALTPPLPELLADPRRGRRSTSATKPRNWESRDIDPGALFKKMAAECQVQELQMRLGLAFGLRVEEQLMFRPHESDKGNWLWVHQGTKGGRWREVDITEPLQRELLERAKLIAARHPKGILAARAWRTLQQARDHYYYLCRKVGLKADGSFRSTPHGARHSFAVGIYEKESGQRAPVIGGGPLPRLEDLRIRQHLAEQLGHGRISATAAYIGTVAHMTALDRRRDKCLEKRERLLAEDDLLQSLSRQANVQTFCLTGAAANGDTPGSLELILCEAPEPVSERLLKAILARAGELLQTRCIPTDRRCVALSGLATFEVRELGRRSSVSPGGPMSPGQLALELE
jgi:integrase